MKRFEDRVSRVQVGPGTLYALPTSVSDIVTFRGSFRSCPDLAANEDLVQALCVSALDKGTQYRSKVEIAETLENVGAEIHFSSDDLRVVFSGRALRKDLGTVIDLLVEQLRHPAFKEEELDLVRVRSIAAARRSMESTSEQAERALRRALFDPAHPNYGLAPEETISLYEATDGEAVRQFHRRHFGSRDLHIVFVGDVDAELVGDEVERAFGSWPDHDETDRITARSNAEMDSSESYVHIADKPNSDVSLGHGLSIRRDDPDFVPLYVGNYILGGNFSARLMQRIRDDLGLTYGIRSSLSDVSIEYDGFWKVSVTLSGENLDTGIRHTVDELRRFVEDGVTGEELRAKQTTISGSYAVGLATTNGLAQALLTNVERGFGPGYLDVFPDEVGAVTLDQVNDVIERHLDAGRLHVATAGSVPPGSPTAAE